MDAALGMFRAMSSAGAPGRMRETPPCVTLLTYLVPSGMITRPSLPGCAAAGPSPEAAMAEFEQALVQWLRFLASTGERVPAADVEIQVSVDEWIATDAHVGTLALAREHAGRDADVRVEHADALALPYADREFDFALCSTALHHFADEDAVQVLRELDRVARLGVVVNDLRRSRPALLGARLLAATVWRTHPVTRHDGPLSVRRSFTPRELLDLGRRAGMREAQVHAHQPFRLALVADRTRGPAGAA